MFHIKSDKRSQTSAKLVCDAMLQLLEIKTFDEITISDIQRKSTIGRATFYRLFDNTIDVLHYLCDQIFENITLQQKDLNQPPSQTMILFIQQWMNNDILLKGIMESGHIEVLYRVIFPRMEDAKQLLHFDVCTDDDSTDYLINIATTALIGGLSAWMKHGKRETADEVFQSIKNVINVLHHTINY